MAAFCTIFGWRAALELLEQPVKSRYAGETGMKGNLCNQTVMIGKKIFCMTDSSVIQIITEGKTGILLE